MPRLTPNEEFCPVARSLELLGERWTVHIVRDLVTGPKRFGDLERLVVGITPKWLTARLRALETAGIVERDDRHYRLTAKGEDLRPLIEELSLWSTKHDLRPPRPSETIVPEHEMWGLEVFLNRTGTRLSKPVTWLVHLDDDSVHTLRFDGERWSWQRGEAEADVVVTTTARDWAGLLAAAHAGERTGSDGYTLTGRPARVREFRRLFMLDPPDYASSHSAGRAPAGTRPG
jgi:DNA-binding HxlR family transcriptional regulator